MNSQKSQVGGFSCFWLRNHHIFFLLIHIGCMLVSARHIVFFEFFLEISTYDESGDSRIKLTCMLYTQFLFF
jgi:hypothetical protein